MGEISKWPAGIGKGIDEMIPRRCKLSRDLSLKLAIVL